MTKKHVSFCIVLLLFWMGAGVEAQESQPRTNGLDEGEAIVANGQGISSPSYWNGLDGENPAGLVFNQTAKLRVGAGSYSCPQGGNAPACRYHYGSGAILIGNGLLGAGLEFRGYGNYFGGNAVGKINWGIAGHLQTISASFGLSSHTLLTGGNTIFDAGAMFELNEKVSLGFMIPNITAHVNAFSGGITYHWTPAFDLVVDADYNSLFSLGVVKPGVTFRLERLEVAVAHGFRYLGSSDTILSRGFTGGVGLTLIHALLFSYEYRGGPDHRLGLTLRFN